MTKHDQMCHEIQLSIFMGFVLSVFPSTSFLHSLNISLQHILYKERFPEQMNKQLLLAA